MPMFPYAPELPEGAFAARQEGQDFCPQINAALRRYPALQLEICNTGKPDQPPGWDGFGNKQYGIANCILVPRASSLMGWQSWIAMMPWFQTQNGVANGIWYTWSAGAQQNNTQRTEGLRLSGLGSDNAAVHSIGMTFDQCNRLIGHDLHTMYCSVGYRILNPQYGYTGRMHSTFNAIGFLVAVFGTPNVAGGCLDIERWGEFYDWGPTDSGSNCNGIGLVHVRGGGTQASPFKISGAYLRDKAQSISIIRDPSNPSTPGFGICLRIEKGSAEYVWGGQGGENEICDTYSNGQRLFDGSPMAPLAVPVGPVVMPIQSDQPLPCPGYAQGQVTAVNGQWPQFSLGDIALLPGDVVSGQNLGLLTHASATVMPIRTRGGMIYLDNDRGLALDEFSINTNAAMILCHAEDGAQLDIGRVAFGGRASFGFRARGPRAQVNFADVIPSGYVRTVWENINERPKHFSGGMEALNAHQRSVILASFDDWPNMGSAGPRNLTTHVSVDTRHRTLTFHAGANPVSDHADWPVINVKPGQWNTARIFLCATDTVRVMPHLRTVDGSSWVAGCSPGHNCDPVNIPIAPTGSSIYNPYGYNGAQYPSPQYFGWDITHCEIKFEGFHDLQVTSTNPGPWGPPPIQGGGSVAEGPYLLGDNVGQESGVLPPDNSLIYHYGACDKDARITARHALPEACTLWAGQWFRIEVLWPAEGNVCLAIAVAQTVESDLTIQYDAYMGEGSPFGARVLAPTLIIPERKPV